MHVLTASNDAYTVRDAQEELETIQRKHGEYEDTRNAELAELQRLEAEAVRRYTEKKRRLAQERKRVAAKDLLEQKVAARALAQSCLSQLHETVFDSLYATGYFYHPVQREVRCLQQNYIRRCFMHSRHTYREQPLARSAYHAL
jgi:hypothetical protein